MEDVMATNAVNSLDGQCSMPGPGTKIRDTRFHGKIPLMMTTSSHLHVSNIHSGAFAGRNMEAGSSLRAEIYPWLVDDRK